MKKVGIVAIGLMSVLAFAGCKKEKDNDESDVPPSPVVDPNIETGTVDIGGVVLYLPDYLLSQSKALTAGDELHAVRIQADLKNANRSETKPASIDWFTKAIECDAVAKAKEFADQGAAVYPDNVPAKLRADTFEFRSWKVDSANFKGLVFLRKSYRSGAETPFFRVNTLFANEKSSVCVAADLMIEPDTATDSDFVKKSEHYEAFEFSFGKTLADLGSTF